MSNKKNRIVMDLQSLQVELQTDKTDVNLLELVANLANHHEVELIVALNGLFINETLAARKLLCNIIPSCNVHTWFPTELPPDSIWHRKVAELIRDAALLSLSPDLIVVPGLVANNAPGVIFTASGLNVPTLASEAALTGAGLIDELNVTSLESLVTDNATVSETVASILKFCKEKTLTTNFAKDLAAATNRPKLAFVSPLPPLKSGIAYYSADLIPELSKYYDVDVVTDQEIVEDKWITKNCQLLSPAFFIENKHLYKRVLYQIGNSPMHAYMIDLLEMIPGVVVLHDFYLGDLNYYIEYHRNRPLWFAHQLYNSHGYKSLIDLYTKVDIHQLLAKYPTTANIFSNAKSVVLHSSFAKQLASKNYPAVSKERYSEVPLFRSPAESIAKSKAREILNISQGDFVVASFGHIGRNKLNHCIIQSWLASSLSENRNCKLIFVGENTADGYASSIQAAVSESDNITITGWTDDATYKQYLAASDVAIQLRSESRGETSAAVLDCMNYGVATIVNASGAMAELDPNGVLILLHDSESEALIADLTIAIEKLKDDVTLRLSLSESASAIVAEKHSLKDCAKGYVNAVEQAKRVDGTDPVTLLERIVALGVPPLSDAERIDTALRITESFPVAVAKKRLFIDVTVVASHDLRTGIQRVVRSIVIEMINKELDGYCIEPVYLSTTGDRWHYRYAREWTAKTLNFSSSWHRDEPIDCTSGDQLLILDFTSGMLTEAMKSGIYDRLRSKGVAVKAVVYDLLPIQFPDFFPPDIDLNHTNWINSVLELDGAVCISESVAIELNEVTKENEHFDPADFPISWFHLGADIDNSSSTMGLSSGVNKVLKSLNDNITFLMVGTIEPRKGNAQVFAAFQLLWKQDVDVNLVFVGKSGWMTDELTKAIKSHRHYNKKLFWLDGISDEYLEKVYAASSCLIAASEGEGFGLPLIEAAQHKLPIIARDIPVFREVAGEYAYYFNNENNPDIIADAIKNWLELYEKNDHPKSDEMPWLTWKESAEQLLTCLNIE